MEYHHFSNQSSILLLWNSIIVYSQVKTDNDFLRNYDNKCVVPMYVQIRSRLLKPLYKMFVLFKNTFFATIVQILNFAQNIAFH